MKQPTTITTAIFATCAILLTACGGGTNSSPNTGTNSTPNSSTDAAATTTSGSIPVGIAFAQTSNVALLGQEGVAGAKIAEKYFNDKGGVNGTPIKLVLQDAGGDEAGAINAFQTLINKDKVVGIVGPTLSQQAFSADPIAERAKVPVIGASNTAKGVPEIGDYIARVSAPVSTVAPLSIKAALKQNPQLKKVAVFFAQNDVFSKSETEIFQKTIKDQGLEIVTVQKFQTSDTDFQSQATNALNLKPDLIVISGLAADGGNLVRQLRELGYKGLIVAGNGLNTAKVFAVCQQACDGVIIAQAYSPQQPAEVNKQFRAAYVKQFKEEPPQFSGQAFTAVQVYVEALKALDKKSKISTMSITKLRTELNKQLLGGKYETPLGEIAFTPVGDIIQKEFYVAQIKVDKDTKKATFSILK
ncbi:branched-chain amino acid ABC transporter substrate-binding protein [Brasilonema octagenarum UFV-E1]|uniref:Branched-chain amino acid ABC transporter substrate-binding protein n=1 Tax=Brasilonema sennae CENA114 TaxID=415709 RepID=A0A856MNX2_9CYAN|nr:ABC transporter substrate-binding protein [Brasilonema sennae]QDL11211.1 branched-chain amino acid ABC transporter substrate-binding protein [Brasilonema sennae CENA114]QDL17556.1 branched-chain amino acid ABC transporter substrate-binding protein [Brasilonema octagenarum UFV-E1]